MSLIIILAIAIASLFYFGPKNIWESIREPRIPTMVQEESYNPNLRGGSLVDIIEPEAAFFINTFIVAGPEEGETIEETTKVIFEFESEILPEETSLKVSFETKIEGVDKDWKKTSSKKRTINLPSDSGEYTFLVRAKIKNSVDPTPAKRTFKINVSPYFEKVTISSIKKETSSRPSLITLNTKLKEEEKINLTGWRIKGKRGNFIIPQGIEKYGHFQGQIPNDNILAKKSDKIYLSAGSNPLGKDRNFRPNKCMGYLMNNYDFPVSFSKNCPKSKKEEISHLDICCQEFILRLSKCEIPDYSGNLVISRDLECLSYLNKNFNFGGCFRNYSQDEDFLEKNWHIYLNRNLVVDDTCDILYLYDQNGLFVDKYSYGRDSCK